LANYKRRYIDCKACGHRITLQIYTGDAVVENGVVEKLLCPDCLKESTYSGDDFKTAELF
jgi:hypothetical protein